jgi:hypothetical protein
MTSGRPFIQPQLVTDSSDDNNDDDDFQPSERPKRRTLKTTDVKNGSGAGVRTSSRSNGDSVAAPQLAKNPLADSDSDLEEILPEPKKSSKTALRKRSRKRIFLAINGLRRKRRAAKKVAAKSPQNGRAGQKNAAIVIAKMKTLIRVP